MSKRATWLSAFALALVTVEVAFASQPDLRPDVYAALFNDKYWGLEPLSKLVVKSAAIPMPSISGSSAYWLTQWGQVPDALRRVAEHTRPTRSLRLDSVLFPPGTRLVDGSAVEAYFGPKGNPDENWASFHRHTGAAGWVGFSDVVFTSDQLDALVYYEGRCGSLRGVGEFVWLRRDSAESSWVIR